MNRLGIYLVAAGCICLVAFLTSFDKLDEPNNEVVAIDAETPITNVVVMDPVVVTMPAKKQE